MFWCQLSDIRNALFHKSEQTFPEDADPFFRDVGLDRPHSRPWSVKFKVVYPNRPGEARGVKEGTVFFLQGRHQPIVPNRLANIDMERAVEIFNHNGRRMWREDAETGEYNEIHQDLFGAYTVNFLVLGTFRMRKTMYIYIPQGVAVSVGQPAALPGLFVGELEIVVSWGGSQMYVRMMSIKSTCRISRFHQSFVTLLPNCSTLPLINAFILACFEHIIIMADKHCWKPWDLPPDRMIKIHYGQWIHQKAAKRQGKLGTSPGRKKTHSDDGRVADKYFRVKMGTYFYRTHPYYFSPESCVLTWLYN